LDSRAEPVNALPPQTRTMWLCEDLATAALLLVVVLTLAGTVGIPLVLALALPAAGVAWAIVMPPLRHRRWRWSLHEEELDLMHGVWRVVRTIVPVTRIQHVSVERTGWSDRFGLVVLHVHTAAGRTTIPGLERPQAAELRDRILERLRAPDDL